MKPLSLLRLAAALLVVAMGVGWLVQGQRAQLHEHYRLSSEALGRVTHLSEQLTSMLTIGVLERDVFRVASYESVRTQLDDSLQEAQALTRKMVLASEMDSLLERAQEVRLAEQQAMVWIYNEMWEQARQALLAEPYTLSRRLQDIDRDAAVGALTGELSRQAQRLEHIHWLVLGLQVAAALLVVWTASRHALVLRTPVQVFTQMQQAQANAQEFAEAQVQVRTAALEADNTRLVHLSTTDALTGISNRRHLDDVMVREFLRAQRSGQSLAVAMLDVDYFKLYNGHYGHPAGDTCLQAIANILTRTVTRAGDIVARYGGEEFVVVAPSTDVEGMCEVARRVQYNLQSIGLTHAYSSFGYVTVSIGVAACVPGHFGAMTPEALLQQADLMLYKAKQAGRNCVMSAVAVEQVLPGPPSQPRSEVA